MQAYVLGAYVSVGSTVYNYFTVSDFYYMRYSAAGFNPDDLGPILALGIPLAWHLATSEGDGGKAYVLKLANYAYVPASVFAIVLSATRGAVIATLPAFVFILGTLTTLKPFARTLILIALVGALIGLQQLVPQSSIQRLATTGESIASSDLNGRVDIWLAGLRVFASHPLVGIGVGAYRPAVGVGKVAHNTFVSILVEVGSIGLLLYMIVLGITFYQAMLQPKWATRLWLSILMVWTLTGSFMSWEHRKQTWLVLGMVTVSGGLFVRHGGGLLRRKMPIRLIGGLKGEMGEATVGPS
jgi:O-antigen ligase